MPELGLATIDKSVQETNRWLDAVMSEMSTDDKQHAYQALRAVLMTLRDRLPVELGAHLGAQLPLLVRGVFYEDYVPADVPHKYRRPEDWKQALARNANGIQETDAQQASRAVFNVLERELDPGIMNKVGETLPDEIRRFVRH